MIAKSFRTFALAALLAGGALAFTGNSAQATLKLFLDDGAGNTKTEIDGDGDGVVSFVGSLPGGSVWTLNITVGRSKPNVGSATEPALRITTTNVSSTGPATLIMMVSDTDFGPTDATTILRSNSSDPLTGGVTSSVWYDPGNSDFNLVTLTAGPVAGSGVYDVMTSGTLAAPFDYSLNLVSILTHAGANTSQFDSSFDTTAVPAPAGLVLLACGLPCLAAGYLRRRKAAKA